MSRQVTIPEELLVFNGIDGRTGQYLIPSMSADQLIDVVLGEKDIEQRDRRARDWKRRSEEPDYLPVAGLDPRQLDQVGWGVVFPATLEQAQLAALREALRELLDHRQQQAGEFYREYAGPGGYRPGEKAKDWLNRHNAGLGRVDPRDGVPPYYLLLVGDPNTLPYEFQYNLDVDRAIGRIYFATLDEFASYARSVVAAEKGQVARARQAVFFGVANPSDRATELSTQYLVNPLLNKLQTNQQTGSEREKEALAAWQFQPVLAEAATHARLQELMGGSQTPALLFTASHGVGFRLGDPEQLDYQGALVCQEWPGPYGGGIQRGHYLAAEDISDGANPFGLISFHFACFGAGTPYHDEFYQRYNKSRAPVAPYAFLARLPRRLLSHPRGGALAVVGHVERAWTHSFKWSTSQQQTADFYDVLYQLMDDCPIGYAMEALNTRYASISAQLSSELEEHEYSPRPPEKLADLWTGNNDARNYSIIGDPAVKLAVAKTAAEMKTDEPIKLVTHREGVLPPVLDPKADPRGASSSAVLTPAVQAAPPTGRSFAPTAAGAVGDDEAFFLGSDTLRDIGANLANALKSLADSVKSATDLEVRTFVSDDIENARFGADGRPTGEAKQRALTLVHLNGNTDVVVPMHQGELDAAIWAIHKDTVAQAWQNRAELLRVLAELVAGLLPKLG